MGKFKVNYIKLRFNDTSGVLVFYKLVPFQISGGFVLCKCCEV